MERFYALLSLCAENSPVTREFPSQRPVTRSFDVFFDLCLNKRLSKHSWGWWFETPMCSLWRHWNESVITLKINQSDCRQRGRWESSQSDTFFLFQRIEPEQILIHPILLPCAICMEEHFTGSNVYSQDINPYNEIEIYTFKSTTTCPKSQWVRGTYLNQLLPCSLIKYHWSLTWKPHPFALDWVPEFVRIPLVTSGTYKKVVW